MSEKNYTEFLTHPESVGWKERQVVTSATPNAVLPMSTTPRYFKEVLLTGAPGNTEDVRVGFNSGCNAIKVSPDGGYVIGRPVDMSKLFCKSTAASQTVYVTGYE